MGIQVAGKVLIKKKKKKSQHVKPCQTHRDHYLDSMDIVETKEKTVVYP